MQRDVNRTLASCCAHPCILLIHRYFFQLVGSYWLKQRGKGTQHGSNDTLPQRKPLGVVKGNFFATY